MKSKSLFLIISLSLISITCYTEDDFKTDCVKKENYAILNFDGKQVEPSMLGSQYDFYISRDYDNPNNWTLSFGINKIKMHLYVRIKDVLEPGDYPIETAKRGDNHLWVAKTSVFMEDKSRSLMPLEEYTYYSLGDTGSIKITQQDSLQGILVGSFSCKVYSMLNKGEIRDLSGKFNINLSSLDTGKRPCWL